MPGTVSILGNRGANTPVAEISYFFFQKKEKSESITYFETPLQSLPGS